MVILVENKKLLVNESKFIVEVIDPDTLEYVKHGEKGEFVLTNLGRVGYPIKILIEGPNSVA